MALITDFHLTGVIFIPTNSAAAVKEHICDPVCKTSLADAAASGCLVSANSPWELQQPSSSWVCLHQSRWCWFDPQTSSFCCWCCIYSVFSKQGPAPGLTRREVSWQTGCRSFRWRSGAPRAAQLCQVSRRDILLSWFTHHVPHQKWIFSLRHGSSKAWCHITVCPTCSASHAWRSLDHPHTSDNKGKGKPTQSARIVNSWLT